VEKEKVVDFTHLVRTDQASFKTQDQGHALNDKSLRTDLQALR